MGETGVSSTGLEVRVLGPVEAARGYDVLALGGPRQRALLACLALRAGQVVSTDRLVEELWGEEASASAAGTIRAYVSHLRTALGSADVVVGRRPGYVLDLPSAAVDALRFEALAGEGRRLFLAGDLAAAAAVLGDALALWRGPVMSGCTVPASLAGRIAGLDDLRLTATEDRVEAEIALGRHGEVLGELEWHVSECPLRERLRELQMLALYRAGRQADALRAYQAARRLLGEELGIAPGRTLQELEAAILRQDPSLDRARSRSPVAASSGSGPSGPPGAVFVGRDGELAALKSAVDGAAKGNGRLVLVQGEAGIGKTRLLDALAASTGSGSASAGSVAVVRSRTDEGQGAPAFWLWVQAVRALLSGRTDEQVQADVAGVASHLALLAPELRTRVPDIEPLPDVEPEAARFMLFDAVTVLLSRRAVERPLAVLFDDLHWADVPSLLLMQFVARRLADLPIALVATCRDDEVAADSATGMVLGAIAGLPGVERVALRGFSKADVADYLRASGAAESELSAEVVGAVWQRTGGNPFFVAEVARSLDDGPGSVVHVPEGVRAAIRQRLARLPADARAVIDVAAVAGREFQLADVQRAARVAREDVMRAVGAGVAAGLVGPVEGSIRAYRFSHDLLRETAYEEVPVHERVAMHDRLGNAIENADWDGSRVAEVADHLYLGAQVGDPVKAVEFALRAAAKAIPSLAYEDAVLHAERAVELLDLADDPAESLRFDALLALGDARWRAGLGESARAAFRDAAESARRSGSAVSLALAGLGYGAAGVTTGMVDEVLVWVCDEALEVLGEEDVALRARVLARLAMELYYSADVSRAAALADEAVALARTQLDQRALGEALAARHFCLRGPDDLADRVRVVEELLSLAERIGDVELALRARQGRIGDLLEMGQIDEFEVERSAYAEMADALHQGQYQGQAMSWSALRMLLQGRFDEVEPVMARALELGQTRNVDFALQSYGAQLATLRREQARHDEVFAALWGMAARFSGAPAWRCAVVLFALEMGRVEDARTGLKSLAEDFDDFEAVPRDVNWFPAMATLAVTAWRLGDAPVAGRLYELLVAFEDRFVVVGGVAPSVSWGSVAYYLGVLASTAGLDDEAVAHFEVALARNGAAGAAPWVAQTQAAYAQVLGSGSQADSLRAAARATAERLGMTMLSADLA